MAILPSALAQMSGYYNISSAMPTLRYLTYDSGSRKIVTYGSVIQHTHLLFLLFPIANTHPSRSPAQQQWFISFDGSGSAFIANRLGGVLTAVNSNVPSNLDLEQAQGLPFAPTAISGQSWKLNPLSNGLFE